MKRLLKAFEGQVFIISTTIHGWGWSGRFGLDGDVWNYGFGCRFVFTVLD